MRAPHSIRTLSSLFAATVALTWASGCSVFGIRTTDEPEFTIVAEDGDFEIRQYETYVVAETVANGSLDETERDCFFRLFDYISGENEGERKLSMTAPVMQEPVSDDERATKLAMTAPVIQDRVDGGWRMAFVLPSEYTIDTAPRPTNPDVQLREVPAKDVGVVRFSGFRSEKNYTEETGRLREWLDERDRSAVSEPRHAGYDPPFTLPFLRRNEVQIDLAPIGSPQP